MKKTLFTMMALVLVIGLAGAGTFAYFSDTETSTGNTFTAGTLDLTVNGQNGQNVQLFNVSNLVPGNQPTGRYRINNIGSINGYLDIESISIVNNENGCIEPETQAGDTTCGPDQGELGAQLNLRMFLDYNNNGWIDTGEPMFFNGRVNTLPANFQLNEPVPAGGGVDFVAEIYDWWSGQDIDDNLAQSDSLVVNMTFELSQTPAQ